MDSRRIWNFLRGSRVEIEQHNVAASDSKKQRVGIDKIQPPDNSVDTLDFIETELYASRLRICSYFRLRQAVTAATLVMLNPIAGWL
jgi:hypothetical protein